MRSVHVQDNNTYQAQSLVPSWVPPPWSKVGTRPSSSGKWSPTVNIVLTGINVTCSYSLGSSSFVLLKGDNGAAVDTTDPVSILYQGGDLAALLTINPGVTFQAFDFRIPVFATQWLAVAELQQNACISPMIIFKAELAV